MQKGDLVLIDAGAELDHYAADITRTFPVSGRFSAEQKAVYDIVLAAQLAAIAAVTPDNHWDKPHTVAVEILTQGLLDLGLLQGSLEQNLEQSLYREFYMHRTGHWLGMDVHDVGDYRVAGEPRRTSAGPMQGGLRLDHPSRPPAGGRFRRPETRTLSCRWLRRRRPRC